MSLTPDRRNPPAIQDNLAVEHCYAAHVALVVAESHNPDLRDNPAWTILRQDAFERFAFALEAE